MTDYRRNDEYRELTPEEIERRRRIREKRRREQLKRKRRRLIAMMALLLVIIVLIIVLCVSCGRKRTGRNDGSGSQNAASDIGTVDSGTQDPSGQLPGSGTGDLTEVTPDSPAGTQIPDGMVATISLNDYFTISEISDPLFDRIKGWSFRHEGSLDRNELSYIRVLHKNAAGNVLIGELIVNSSIAESTLIVFKELYNASFPIEHMILVDSFEADDYLAMEADDTFCFNDNKNASDGETPINSFGTAINVNPLYNPFVPDPYRSVPENGLDYSDRDRDNPYMIRKGDDCYNAFINNGFVWAGDNETLPNYMRFEYR